MSHFLGRQKRQRQPSLRLAVDAPRARSQSVRPSCKRSLRLSGFAKTQKIFKVYGRLVELWRTLVNLPNRDGFTDFVRGHFGTDKGYRQDLQKISICVRGNGSSWEGSASGGGLDERYGF